MKKAIITVGLGMGDEGKGTAVDYLCRLHNADLVVRYSGGMQCGHNVCLPDGRHHEFHLFGSGTFLGIETHLDKNVIVSAEVLTKEIEELKTKRIGNPQKLISIHPQCLVATPWHKLLNQIKELYRCGLAHGSCGHGLGETRKYWLDYGNEALMVGDLEEGYVQRLSALNKLNLIKQRLLLQAQEYVTNKNHNLISTMNKIDVKKCYESMEVLRECIAYYDPDCNIAVFEAAQGILLDENYGFHPHTTWSTTTDKHALEMIPDGVEIERIGITRTYQTRHGNGPMPSYDPSIKPPKGEHNNLNDWQGKFRIGVFDVPLAKYAIEANEGIDCLFVTCRDHLKNDQIEYVDYSWGTHIKNPVPSTVINERKCDYLYNNIITPPIKIMYFHDFFNKYFLDIPLRYISSGPTHEDKHMVYNVRVG